MKMLIKILFFKVSFKSILFFFTTLFFYYNVLAQDPSFHQYDASPIYLNPANTGRSFGTRFGLNYKYQPAIWHKFPGPFSTANAYFDKLLCNKRLGFGMNVINNIEGEGFLKTTIISGSIGAHVPLWKPKNTNSSAYLSGGMKFSAGNNQIDYSRLVFSDQITNPTSTSVTQSSFIPPNYDNNWFMDADAGIHFSGSVQDGKKTKFAFDLGSAVSHIFEPVTSLINLESVLPRKYNIYTSIIFPLTNSKNLSTFLNPHFIIEKQGIFQNTGTGLKVLFGTNGRFNNIDRKVIYNRKYFGIMYNVRSFADSKIDIKTLVFSAGISHYTKNDRYQIQAGLSWGFPVTQIIYEVPGTPEISLVFTIPSYNCDHASKSRKQNLRNKSSKKRNKRFRGQGLDCPVIGINF